MNLIRNLPFNYNFFITEVNDRPCNNYNKRNFIILISYYSTDDKKPPEELIIYNIYNDWGSATPFILLLSQVGLSIFN